MMLMMMIFSDKGRKEEARGDFRNPQVCFCRTAEHLRSVGGKFHDDYHCSHGDCCDDCDDNLMTIITAVTVMIVMIVMKIWIFESPSLGFTSLKMYL